MCIYDMFSNYLRFIVSKKGKTLNSKKIEALVKMLVPKTPYKIKVFYGMAQFYKYFIKKKFILWHQSLSYLEKLKCLNGLLNVKPFGKISKTDTSKLLYLSILTRNWNFMFILIHLS